jgi:isopenicillin N synthase-like dioxygenase
MDDYFLEVERLSLCLQKGFALALGLEGDFFQPFFDCPTSRLKINHYPVQEGEITEHNLGVVPHTNSGGYTILWQDNKGGLEIQSKSGEWVGAPPIENTFVINIGNIMQYWSNGAFSSTPHRVINRKGGDRFSIPLFVNPNYEVDIKPLVETDTPTFEPFNYGDYQLNLWRRTFPIANIPQK